MNKVVARVLYSFINQLTFLLNTLASLTKLDNFGKTFSCCQLMIMFVGNPDLFAISLIDRFDWPIAKHNLLAKYSALFESSIYPLRSYLYTPGLTGYNYSFLVRLLKK
ncbi:hypothetical protein OENI_150022 [Oenococcus oeni]|nr:hypothetical protein OENI_150022 [Oenococcus oeni]